MPQGPADSSEPFELLANETRLGIIRELGAAMAGQEHTPQAFSELQAAVGVEDNGKFSYHLRKLVGRFVEKTDEGYRLLPAGIGVFQAIIAGTYHVGLEIPPRPEEDPCGTCGEPTSVWYEDGRFHTACLDCEDGSRDYPLPPGTFDHDDPTAMADAASKRIKRDLRSFLRGVCPYCSGTVEGTLHDSPPPGMGERWQAFAVFSCERCYWFLKSSLGAAHREHPAVVSFFYERGLDIQDVRPWNKPFDYEIRRVSEAPLAFSVTFRMDGDERTIVVDEALDVVDVVDGAFDVESYDRVEAGKSTD